MLVFSAGVALSARAAIQIDEGTTDAPDPD
jgi:hypothetical protein